VCLKCRWLVDGGHLRVIGDSYGVSESSVHRIVHRGVRTIVIRLFRRVIRWPLTVDEREADRDRFYAIDTPSIQCRQLQVN